MARPTDAQQPWRVVVCGSKFGRVYMSALSRESGDMQLAGILAAGSERSRRCADHYGVPLYTSVDDVPGDVHAACVVVGSGIAGGPGTEIAERFLERGVPVLQEHPIHHDELAELMRIAGRNRVVHRMNTLYPFVDSVRRFIQAGLELLRDNPPAYVTGACSIQLKTSFIDILCRIVGKLRPWRYEALPVASGSVAVPFRSVQGVIGGVPVSLQIQNQLHATDPDNHAYLYHSIRIGTAVGSLCLVDTHGPVIWQPRPHIPRELQADRFLEDCAAPSLELPTTTTLLDPGTTWRDAVHQEWPAAVLRALRSLRAEVEGGQRERDPQYYLSMMQMIHELDRELGPPQTLRDETPEPRSADAAVPSMAAGC